MESSIDNLSKQYSQEFELLKKKSLEELKDMAKLLGVPTSSKLKRKADWVEAIITFCSSDGSDTTQSDTGSSRSSVTISPLVDSGRVNDYIPTDIGAVDTSYAPQVNTTNHIPTSQKRPAQAVKEPFSVPTQQFDIPNQQNQNPYSVGNAYMPQNQAYMQNSSMAYPPQQRSNYEQAHYYSDQAARRKPAYPAQGMMQPQMNMQPVSPKADTQYFNAQQQTYRQYNNDQRAYRPEDQQEMYASDNGISCEYILEVMPDGYGFLRSNNYLSGTADVYLSSQQIKKYKLRTGDIVRGKTRKAQAGEKYPPLLLVETVNGMPPEAVSDRVPFDELTPIYPNERITLERDDKNTLAVRLVDLFAPIGKGQRGLIVSQPKAGKTTLLKDIANSITHNYPDIHLIVLLIDERPEEVTDIKRSIQSSHEGQVEVLYSTFDELPDHHTKVAEMVMERSMRLVENGRDVVVLMDSITRLARAYNITMPSTGKTLSGGMDPSALFKPKRFFGAARNIENGGSLTIRATALVETGSRMDDIVYEEFKGTGNMEIHLDRSLSEKRIFPAIDIYKSGTRHDDLLLSEDEFECITAIRRTLSSNDTAEVTEQILSMFSTSKNNDAFINQMSSWVTKYFKS